MGFVNYIIELLRDPRSFIASMIATGPLAAYGFVFLIVFIETGVVFFPFLPGDSLLFAAGFFAHSGGFNIVLLLVNSWRSDELYDWPFLWKKNYCFRKSESTHSRASRKNSEVPG